MSRKDWTEYDRETRKYIKKRDNNKCIICGSNNNLQIMHIWLNRSHGGKGCKENGVLGCSDCHRILDNPIGIEQNNKSKIFMEICKNHLIEKEHITPNEEFIETLKYHKNSIIINTDIDKIKEIQQYKKKQRCKNCIHLVKNKYANMNSSICSYYCKYRHMLIHKTTEACKNFKSN